MKAEIETLHEWRRRAEPAYLSRDGLYRLIRRHGLTAEALPEGYSEREISREAGRLAARIEKHARATGLRSRQEEEVEPVAGD